MPTITAKDLSIEETENAGGSQRLPDPGQVAAEPTFLGESAAMKEVRCRLLGAVLAARPALLVGETGTGKDVAARFLHHRSRNATGPFVKVRLPELGPDQFCGRVYGRENYASPGASCRPTGLAHQAAAGTLYLEEIASVRPDEQGYLVPLVENLVYKPPGGVRWWDLGARLVISTCRDLHSAVSEGRFLAELHRCLSLVAIHLPPLRDRREDIPDLAEHSLRQAAAEYRFAPTALTTAAIGALQEYDWPGNMHELQRIVVRAMADVYGRPIEPEHLQFPRAAVPNPSPSTTGWPSLVEHERQYIVGVLEHTHWDVKGAHGAARILQLNPSTLRYRIRKLGLLPREARKCRSA